MIIKGISIRLKLLITTLVTIVLLVALSLVILNASNQLSLTRELMSEQSGMTSRFHSLEHTYDLLIENQDHNMIAACIKDALDLEMLISKIADYSINAEEEHLTLKARQISSSIQHLVDELSALPQNDSARLLQLETEFLVLAKLVNDFDSALYIREKSLIGDHRAKLTISLTLGIFFIGLFLILFSQNLSRSFFALTGFTDKLQKGALPPPLDLPPGDEMGQIAADLNKHVSDLQSKIRYINSLANEGSTPIYSPDEKDEIGNALVVLSNYMTRKELNEVTRNREDKKQNWISDGMAQIGNVLRSERENVMELSHTIIQKLVTYMNVEMGSLFISNLSDPENPTLILTASYAYDRRKYRTTSLEWGAGLPGTCAQEKKRIFLTDVPEHYFEVSSGTGSAQPNCLLLVPMMIDDTVYGIIELATIRLLRLFEIEFVESLAEDIASSLLAVQTNERTSQLLKQSQAQADALKIQETTMKENMRQLEEAQAESGKKESEINGILNAIEQSTLVAELGLNRRYTSINDRFLLLLESQRDQVLGKLHSEIAQADPSSEEYKTFWSSLREGKSTFNTEVYKLFSGKEIWLKQTFTPIINSSGKVYKILNIAEDITETRMLQERLQSSEHEITRSNLDMQTLNEAVNTALIKCELDPEGIIMNVNEKYNEITGYRRKELLGRNYRMFLKDSEKDQFEKIWDEVSKQKVYEGVIRRSRPTGEEAWLVSTFAPVIDESGVIYKVYFMGFDITEKKLKYQLLEDANQEIDRLKEQLNNDLS